MNLEKIEKILNKIDAVPTLPITATQLANALQSRKTSSNDVAEIIKNDPALTAKVLKLVNSPFYGFSQKITTIQRAITLLGFDMITSLSLSITIFEIVNKDNSDTAFSPEDFWKHSLGVAISSQIIAESIKFQESETAFVAGLLHDIGKIIEVSFMAEEYRIMIELLKKGEKYIEAEKKVLGVDHTYIGSVVANSWNLPQIIINPIKYHHQYNKSLSIQPNCLTLTAIVHLADILVKTQMFGFSGDNDIPELIKDFWLVLNINKETLEKIINKLPNEFEKSMHLIDIIL